MYSYSPAKKYRAGDSGSGSGSDSVAVEVAAPFPAVGVAAAAAAPTVVAALRVRVPGPGVVCVFQPLPRLLPVLDEDAGSVGTRGQPWSPPGAYPRGGFMRGNGRGRWCNLSQEQILGEAGIGLITDVVASGTSADQLRTRLGERTSRVADLETSFGG